ncbi:MAG: cysteine--tRNA ligase [Candidatus Nealsonbacteria bacterium]|nr:cysteine--tRNA ligase [Candidatus Nealsonbacteria bacterium]
MLKIYNTLSQKKEILKPRKGKKINLFVCGPTTYDLSHLGHARTYLAFDAMAKYLKQEGYDVFYLQNITDVDDKIINRAKEQNLSWLELSRKFEKEYLKDAKSLGIKSVSKYARATAHLKEIVSQVERLLKKGYAYEIKGDGIYYDIAKFKDYGKLSGRTALGAESATSRIDESVNKKNKGDFCLWKLSKPGEPQWKSPWGLGRPGWHIEDTAITEKYFGPQYDIHGGARDLIFPHHEAEIAQIEAVSGKKPLVKYWMHTGFLTVNGEKMTKSLGNFITIQDFLKSHPVRLLRFFLLKSHYRSPIDYSEKLLSQAKQELERVDEFVGKLKTQNSKTATQRFELEEFQKRFSEAMADDFNTPQAIAAIFELITAGNALISVNKLDRAEAKAILRFLKRIDVFFGFILSKKTKEEIPEEVWHLIKQREYYRKNNLWQKADEMREKISNLGYQVEDTKEGPKLKKI